MTHREYLDLVAEMIEHDRHYYDEAQPRISDYEYDRKMQSLIEYEKRHPQEVDPNSPAQRVAESPTEGFQQRSHLTPMYSLANTYSEEEVGRFVNRVHKLLQTKEVAFCCELKMDGTAISLLYERGKLIHALTRGNGKVGDDVTANIKTIQSVPLQLSSAHVPDVCEVRGEVFLSLATFRTLNAAREEEGLEPFANPRNAAAGSLKLLHSQEVAKRRLGLVTYAIEAKGLAVETQFEVHGLLHKLGLPTAAPKHIAKAHDLASIIKFAEKVHQERKHLPFEIDGIVIKVDPLASHEALGYTGKTPRFAIAYKFAPEQALTRVEEIVVQVGRSGVITPVAELTPVLLAGSTISRATLHNQEEVERKDIREGDWVVIEKGGDVIPKVVSVDLKKRGPDSKPWHMPKHCPICDTTLVHHVGEVAVRCPSPRCAGQRVRKIIYFASKHAMDIEHMGEKVVEQLVNKGLISRISDIYLLNEESLSELDGFKEKSIHNLLTSIHASRKCPLSRFLMGLGIKYVGTQTADLLAEHMGRLDVLMQASVDDLLAIDGIGEKTAVAIVAFFQEAENREEIARLLKHGVEPQAPKKKKHVGHLFSGKVFVLTGALEHYSRDEASELIKERGGKVAGSVSQNTDYLLVGGEPGSKYEKAKKLGVPILSERQFRDMLTN